MENIEWIFSGIGIFVLSSIIILIRNKRSKLEEQINNAVKIYCDILDGKINGHTGIPGLIRAGLSSFTNYKDLKKVLDKIKSLGHPYPISNFILNNILERDILDFIKWQSKRKIKGTDYFNETSFSKLAKEYYNEKK
jgi:hypothetical protein